VHRLQAALAGALEEDLLDDPSELHFALAPNAAAQMKAGLAFDVMVCNKAWLRQQLTKRSEQNLSTERITPSEANYEAAGWNLAQFDFAPQTAWRAKLVGAWAQLVQARQWSAARWAVFLLFMVQLVGVNLWAWRERDELAQKQAQINQILLQTFPSTPLVVDAPAQMEKAVAALRISSGALGDKALESQLAQLSATLKQTPTQLDFVAGELKVTP
jgi:general secretion pathway protein L